MEMTTEQVRRLSIDNIIKEIEKGRKYQVEHKAITWEHGVDLINIITIHGDIIISALEEYKKKL